MRPGATQRCPRGLASAVSEWTWLPLTPQQARTFGWVALLDAPAAAQAQGLETDDAADEASAAPSQAGAFVGPPGGYKVEFPDGEESRLRYMRACSPSDGAAQVRTEFRISNRGDLPDPTEHIQNGAKRVAQLFATKPQATLPFEDEARKVMMGNQVAQSIRAEQRADDDTTLAALEANAAGQQGVHAALLAILDYAGGGGSLDPQCGLPIITTEHVQCARRLLDISIAIRAIWRAPPDEDGVGGESEGEGDDERMRLAQPVRGHYPAEGFGEPLATQAQTSEEALLAPLAAHRPEPTGAPLDAGGAGFGPAIEQPVPAAAEAGEEAHALPLDDDAQGPEVLTLQFEDVPGEGDFDKEGLGEAGAMIFTNLVRRLLLTGRSGFPVNACVDNYNVAAVEHGEDAKRKKRIKPPKSQVMQVLKAAFQQFTRLGTFKEQNGEVLFKGWPTSVRGQTLFHTELMRCCRVSLRQVSQKRAHFHEGRPTPIQPKAKSVAQAPAESRLP